MVLIYLEKGLRNRLWILLIKYPNALTYVITVSRKRGKQGAKLFPQFRVMSVQ